MKIAFFSYKSYDKEWFNKFNEEYGFEFRYFKVKLTEETVVYAKGCDAVCAFVNDDLGRPIIENLAQLGVKMIAMRCAGFNNVDLDATKQHGIKVFRVPAYSPHAVAEHAVALILTLNRKTHKAYNRVREGNFSLERLTGFNLYGKTIGVIGTGKIGAIFCNLMLGFGCKVLAYDLYPNEELKKQGIKYTDLTELLSSSDIVSLNTPLLPETAHMINKYTLNLMKDGAMLINTSRGGLIDTMDAIDALKSGKLGSLGIDVYEQEEGLFFHNLSEKVITDDKISRLLSFPNVLITSHQAFFTREALDEISKVTLQNILDFQKGKDNKNIVLG
ncbi:2-hydroxyacid dehydrogenase [Sediminitomix flava]|uniref:D-lactate dehydrogenase n=1 Tax=Sediminitomix flava TaxID=379075 RepID=A0A315Z613_SEDFL|nr:2-hydroxyacid dehydrogenase [Sediminitomix flava]PWJ39348.1 D-lactate dehydrogenase [Sediminitomix flava]